MQSALSLPMFVQHLDGVEEALKRCGDTATIQSIIDDIVEGKVFAIGNEDGLLLIQFTEDKFVHFWIATGDLDEVIALANRVMDEAKEKGYTKASLIGRRGWARALKSEGWSERSVYMEKDIGEG